MNDLYYGVSLSVLALAAHGPQAPAARPRLKSLRQLWLKLHLYIALGIGFMFVLLGLTGSLNVFQMEIDEWLNPELVIKHPQGAYRPLDEVLCGRCAMSTRCAKARG